MNNSVLTPSEQEELVKKLEIFKIQGRDKRGNPVLQIIGKHFPGRVVIAEGVKKYLENEIFPCLDENQRFSVVYVHTRVNRSDNFPGIATLKSIYEAILIKLKHNLDAFYFLHPGLHSRLFLATFGRLLFAGLYWKLTYVTRLEFLWDNVKRKGIEIPEFVYDFDEEMDYCPTMDYGIESDHPGFVHGALTLDLDSSVSTYSMRCIA